jgi:hypothetical protein
VQKLITFKDSWIWFLLNAICLGAFTKAVLYQLAHVFNPGIFVVGFVILCILGITVYRYVLRYLHIKKWQNAPHTDHNMAVFSDKPLDGDSVNLFNSISTTVVDFWAFWAGITQPNTTYTEAETKILNALNGGTISLTSNPIYMGTPFWSGKFLGVQEGNCVTIVNNNKDQMLQLFKHELSHLALGAVGVDPGDFGIKHHEIFAQTNFC